MSLSPIVPAVDSSDGVEPSRTQLRNRRTAPPPSSFRYDTHASALDAPLHHAELFYLQKQIQSQTPMVIILEDGEQIQGCIEWYDRNTLKVRGRAKTLIYKSAIKYMYKLVDVGQ